MFFRTSVAFSLLKTLSHYLSSDLDPRTQKLVMPSEKSVADPNPHYFRKLDQDSDPH